MPVDPGFGERLARRVSELFADAELSLLRRIANSLAQDMAAPDWASSKLLQLAFLRRRWAGELADLDVAAQEQILRVVAEAWHSGQALAVADLDLLGMRITMPPARVNAIEAIAAQTIGQVSATRGPVLRLISDLYQQVVAEASVTVLTGADTRRAAAQTALNRLTANGVTGFRDSAGRNWSMTSYVEMAVRTSAGKAAVDGHVDQLAVNGIDLVMVSDAPRECPACRPWEGKVLSLSGGVAGAITVPSLTNGRPTVVKVAGSLAQARAAGLQHPNCRHSVSAYLPGATRRPTVTADRAQGYEAQQRQREIERTIRAWKLREATALDDVARRDANVKVRQWQAALRQHLAANPDLKRQSAREQIGQAI